VIATAHLLQVLDDGVRDGLRGYVVVGLGSPDAPLPFGERLQVCLLAADGNWLACSDGICRPLV
jgi:hypothetical protein